MTRKPDVSLLKQLPQIEEVLQQPALQALADRLPHALVADAVRTEVDILRQSILAGQTPRIETEDIARKAAARAQGLEQASLRHVVNASGVIIHTNLGRSVLAPQAIEAVNDVIRGYSTLEYDTQKMARGSRHDHCEKLICAITGAEAAIAVNNNAAAVMMVLSEFASGREGMVSRGELIEIGGSFRIPDIMEQSHATMVEVGTTNKTHPADYERAITSDTAMLLKVHRSNYRLIGFTEEVDISELRQIADRQNKTRAAAGQQPILVYEDQGSGSFERLDVFGEYAEPTVAESLAAGADLVSFSGDKLLGGPQAGIIVGSKEMVDRLKANPLARALRLDKMTLAALEATMRLYLHPEQAKKQIPTLRMLTEPAETVRGRAESLQRLIAERIPEDAAKLSLEPEISRAGGGALPMCDIDTFAVQIAFKRGDAQDCARFLEQNRRTPIIVRIKNDRLLCDARTILNGDEQQLIADGLGAYFAQLP